MDPEPEPESSKFQNKHKSGSGAKSGPGIVTYLWQSSIVTRDVKIPQPDLAADLYFWVFFVNMLIPIPNLDPEPYYYNTGFGSGFLTILTIPDPRKTGIVKFLIVTEISRSKRFS